MNMTLRSSLFAALLAATGVATVAAPLPALAQQASLQVTPQVSPQAATSDQAVHADNQTYRAVQARIKAQNDAGIRVADYYLSKAQCWLDVSLHEYTRNDRSAFPQLALSEADKILRALEQKATPNPGDLTPLVNDAVKLREDLWQRFAHLKQTDGMRCASQKIACAEVELVHAGNEFQQQGWRHANPYIQIAEDLTSEGEAAAASCTPPVTTLPPPAPVKCQPCAAGPVVAEKLELAADALFKFDKYAQADLLPTGRARIDDMMQKLDTVFARIDSIVLVGHTDRLGSVSYNQLLSERRAQTIKQYITDKGFKGRIEAAGKGKSMQVLACQDVTPRHALIACLQPNRRVEINVTGVKR
jgi:outer membrane protein OmpA-like peptidoglycan-associated protein